MTSSQTLLKVRLINESDRPTCTLPAPLGPAKQSACFSIIRKRLEVDSTAAMRFFVQPPLNINLRLGMRKFMQQPLQDRAFQRARRLDNIFEMCLSAQNSEELLKAEVVTWRGIISKIVLGKNIDLNISYYEGVLYLEEDSGLCGLFDRDSEGTYRGHKFESYCTAAVPGGPGGLGSVDLHTLWAAGITRTLGSLNILLVGEVDSVKSTYLQSPGPEHYVELKTRKWEAHLAGKGNQNRRKWDIQSHLVGASDIFVGYPDAQGIVRQYDATAVRDMEPVQSRIDWAARVLHQLREHCGAAEGTFPLKIWRVEVRSKYVDVRELGEEEVRKLNKGGASRSGIIPLSFMRGLERRRGRGSG